MDQSRLENHSRGCAKTPILTVLSLVFDVVSFVQYCFVPSSILLFKDRSGNIKLKPDGKGSRGLGMGLGGGADRLWG